MKLHRLCLASAALAALMATPPAARAVVIPTSLGLGADAEVRESNPTQNRGDNTEIASRIINKDGTAGNDRNSVIYLKFDISGQGPVAGLTSSVRMTYRNNNLRASRISDTFTPDPDFRTGMAFYGLDPDDPGNNWEEIGVNGITYLTAPGLVSDFDVGTKDYFLSTAGGPLIPLGVQLFPEIGSQNHLPVGGEFLFESTELDAFIGDAIASGNDTVTIVAGVVHDGKNPVSDWLNFNYIFNPKEQTVLNDDSNYDADVNDPNNPLGSPFSGASNATDANGFSPFSPQLRIVPEPGTLALACVAGCAWLAMRRRR